MKPLGGIGIVSFIAVLNSFFIVDQREQSLVLQVGAAVEAYNEPGTDEAGLKFKIPFVQSVVTYDKRNLGLDVPNIEVFASNQEQLIDCGSRQRQYRCAIQACGSSARRIAACV